MTDKNQATELIYLTYDGNFQLETNAIVQYCRVISDDSPRDTNIDESKTDPNQQVVRIEVQLDQTTMHPQGGGQPTDIGTIQPCDTDESLVAQIDKVTIDRATGIVTHAGFITIHPNEIKSIGSSIFSQSNSVKVAVASSNRRILSECHTAGHVVDAAMAKCEVILPPTKGYHFMDGPYVEYRGTIENKEEFLEKLKGVYTVR